MASVSETELRRLGRFLSLPVWHVGRRSATINLSSSSTLRFREDIELLVASLPDDDGSEEIRRVVSIGLFSKEFRLPDLRVSQGGSRIAVYSRNDRERILGALFLARFEARAGLERGFYPTQAHAELFAPELNLNGAQMRQAIATIGRIYTAAPKVAKDELRMLRLWMQGLGLGWLAWKSEFDGALSGLVTETHLLVEVKAAPSETVVLTLEYSMPAGAANPIAEFDLGDRPPKALFALPRALLRFLGLTPWAVSVEVPSADHCESFHVVVQAEEGMSIEDVYFEEAPLLRPSARESESDFQRGSSVWLARRWDDSQGRVRAKPVVWFGVHSMSKQTSFVAWALTSLAAFVLRQVAQDPLVLEDGSSSFLVAIPGLLTAVLAQTRGSSQVGHGWGPRSMLYLVATFPFLVAAVQLFGGPPDLSYLARVGAAYTAVASVVFLTAFLSPRAPVGKKRFASVNDRRSFYRLRDVLATVGLLVALLVGAAAYATADGPDQGGGSEGECATCDVAMS